MEKEKIRPFYGELQGYLLQAPKVKSNIDAINNKSLWERYNQTVAELQAISKRDYSCFCVQPQRDNLGHFVYVLEYRQALGGLISRLHAEYFSDEPAPFGMGPSTVISQTQQQNQSVHVQMLLEVQSKIDKKIPDYPEGSKERKFLEKFKGMLSSIKNAGQLLGQFIAMAKEFGLNIDEVLKVVS